MNKIEDLYQYRQHLVNFLKNRNASKDEAEDIVHDVFTRLLDNPNRYDLAKAKVPFTFLCRCVANRQIDCSRRVYNKYVIPNTLVFDYTDTETGQRLIDQDEMPNSRTLSQLFETIDQQAVDYHNDLAVDYKKVHQIIMKGIQFLTQEEQSVLYLVVANGMPYAQVAIDLDLDLRHVAYIVKQSKTKLQRWFIDNYPELAFEFVETVFKSNKPSWTKAKQQTRNYGKTHA
jgi:RNA polymerase sigma factor (sigma-70 family)